MEDEGVAGVEVEEWLTEVVEVDDDFSAPDAIQYSEVPGDELHHWACMSHWHVEDPRLF